MTKVEKIRHKKREREALLYKLEVQLNSDGNLMFNYEWVNPSKLLDALKKYKSYDAKHILCSIIRHCVSNSHALDSEIKYLLRNI